MALHTVADLNFPKIDGLELEPRSLYYMPRPECICVEITLTVRVEEAFLVAVQDSR